MPWTVAPRGRPDDGTVVGATKLGDLDLPSESAHIGWTAYDPRVWGTAVNPEAKLLLLGLAFDHGFGRVKLQADARNDRSRAAILSSARSSRASPAATSREPTARGGTRRCTRSPSTTGPSVRAGLEARLAAWRRPGSRSDADPNARR